MVVTTLKTAAALVAFSVLMFYAIVGVLFLHEVEARKQSTEVCPRVVRYEDGSLACVVPMQAEDDDIMIMRGE